MSNIGLNSSTYQVTGKYLKMLNDFVARNKRNDTVPASNKVELLKFITKVQDQNTTDPQMQLLSSIIERDLRQHKQKSSIFFSSLVKELKGDDVSAIIGKIEIVIEALDSGHFEALSRIKGE